MYAKLRSTLSYVLPLCCGLYSFHTFAQTPIDAGSLLKEQPKAPQMAPKKTLPIQGAPQQTTPKASGTQVLVKRFQIIGAELISTEELEQFLNSTLGDEPLSLEELRALTILVSGYYAQQGYLAKAILPPQDIVDGVVKIQVIEGKRGDLHLSPDSDESGDRAIDFINERLGPGDAMNLEKLGAAITILNEQPGMGATIDLARGQSEAEIDVSLVSRLETPREIFASLNNTGSYGTGEEQVLASIRFNGLSEHFDTTSVLVNAAEGSAFIRGDYSLALGNRGLRVGVGASYLDYELVANEFAALDATGTAETFSLNASYPLIRRSTLSLTTTASVDFLALKDRTVAGETSHRKVDTLNLGVNGYTLVDWLGGSLVTFSSGVVLGDSDQLNQTALVSDRTTRDSANSFAKFEYSVGFVGQLQNQWQLNANLRGQFADGNLDSSQQMSLGGVHGVRAYPTGEASGDEAWLINLSASKSLSDNVVGTVFYDIGRVKRNDALWANWNASNPSLENTYTLSGLGVTIDWQMAQNALLSATIATPLEGNSGADANGNNVDGDENGARLWLALTAQF